MKKILLITAGDFSHLSGIENYNLLLINIIKKFYTNFQIDIVLTGCDNNPTINNKNNLNFVYWWIYGKKFNNFVFNFFKLLNANFHVRKEFKKIMNNYDLIIDSSQVNFASAKKLKNYYLIQHFNINEIYLWKYIHPHSIVDYIRKLVHRFITKESTFVDNAQNFVVYDDVTKDIIKQYKPDTNVIIIPLPSKIKPLSIENLSTNNRKRIIFFGRLAEQKNIPDLMLINDSLHQIDFYGQALTKEGIKYEQALKEKGWYKGYICNDKELTSILGSYKFSILYSTKKEGFSFSLVESLSQGIPIIVKDSFPSASYLCNEQRGLLLPKNSTVKEDIEKIIEFIKLLNSKYVELQKNCINFYLKNLSYEIFEEKWKKIFNQYLDKK